MESLSQTLHLFYFRQFSKIQVEVLGITLIQHHSLASVLQQFLEPESAISFEMASNSCSSHGDNDFIGLMRLFNEDKEHVDDHRISFPTWVEEYCDYSHTKHAQAGVHDLSHPDLEVQRKMGVLINKVWTVEMKDPVHLAQYCAFKGIRELSSYVDVIGKHHTPQHRRLTC